MYTKYTFLMEQCLRKQRWVSFISFSVLSVVAAQWSRNIYCFCRILALILSQQSTGLWCFPLQLCGAIRDFTVTACLLPVQACIIKAGTLAAKCYYPLLCLCGTLQELNSLSWVLKSSRFIFQLVEQTKTKKKTFCFVHMFSNRLCQVLSARYGSFLN